MPKKAKELAPLQVSRLKEQGLHAVGVVPGLHLQIKGDARSWILRVTVGTKRRDIGLGAFPAVTLEQARQNARETRESIAQGIDPILTRKSARSALEARQKAAITFDEAARRFIDAKSDEWRNAKHHQQWVNTLAMYASPVIGGLHVSDITQGHVLSALQPIWKTKTETANRVRSRIELVLDWATVRGYRKGDNPARWKGHLDMLLPKPAKITRTKHHEAITIDDMPAFMTELRKREGTGARALEFLILTATRSGETRGATWPEIDLDGATWTIPAERMKGGREHRVPLSKAALDLLQSLPRIEGADLVFPGAREGKPLSDMTLAAVMRRIGTDAVPHGFRSTFRDWTAERTNYPRDVAEMALAHAIESKVESAYRRGDLFAKRAHMMTAWAAFLDTPARAEARLLPIRKTA